MTDIFDINDEDFQEKVIEKSKELPVIVDFWADWCGPCKMLSPILEAFTKENEGKFVLAKCNVDDARQKAAEYAIRSIPSVKLFKDGEVVDEFVGVLPSKQIQEWLEKNL
jgi:thioredoxin